MTDFDPLPDDDAFTPVKPYSSKRLTLMEWQPIETAPKDGSLILLADIHLYNGPEVFAARWGGSDQKYPWVFLDLSKEGQPMLNAMMDALGPTHWMPLPEPPKV